MMMMMTIFAINYIQIKLSIITIFLREAESEEDWWWSKRHLAEVTRKENTRTALILLFSLNKLV